jgi:hypothetical protein
MRMPLIIRVAAHIARRSRRHFACVSRLPAFRRNSHAIRLQNTYILFNGPQWPFTGAKK